MRQSVAGHKKWKNEVFLASECQERFLFMSDIPEMKKHDVFMAGLALLEKEYWVERISPDVHTVLFTLEGAGVLYSSQGRFDICPNTITFLPAGEPFRFELAESCTVWKMVWLLLSDVERWKYIYAFPRPSVYYFDGCESIWSLASLVYREVGGRSTFRNMMLSELVRNLSNVDIHLSDTHMRVFSVLNIVESQLHLNWTVSEIAARSFLSEKQLNRVVKCIVGTSTRDFLITLRMKKSLDLLDNKDWSIKRIALRLGYNDPNNFTHRFRKVYGVSPRQYRRVRKYKY